MDKSRYWTKEKKKKLKFEFLTDFKQKNTFFGQIFAMYWLEKISCNKKKKTFIQ